MNMKNKIIICISLINLCVNAIFAQGGGNIGQSDIITFGPRPIERAKKQSDQPAIVDTVVASPNLNYSFLAVQAQTNFEPEKIEAAKIKVENNLEKLYRFYAKAGIGMYTTPLAELWINDLYNKKGSYGAHFKHFSSQGGIKNLGFNGFSDNEIGLYGKYFFNKNELGAKFDYQRNVIHYYGFKPDSLFNPEKEQIRQRFNIIGAQAYFKTYHPDSLKLNHREVINYYYLTDAYAAKEHNISASTRLDKKINNEIYALDASLSYNDFVNTFTFANCLNCFDNPQPGNYQQNFMMAINPTINTGTKKLYVRAGLAAYMDIFNNKSFFHFYPDIEARYRLFNDVFVPYAGINGKKIRNSYRSITDENPFTISSVMLNNTNHKLNIYGGFRGTLSSNISFNTGVSFLKTENSVLFINETVYSVRNKFTVVYENLDILNLSAQIHWQKSEKIKLLLRGNYFTYSTLEEEKAWSLPDFKFTGSFIYDMYDKIIIRADLFVTGSRWFKALPADEGAEPKNSLYMIKLKPFIDLNLGAEYRYTKRISAFINFNNIAAKKYQYWYRFPVQGINILGGLTYAF
jgi:hypothetical protein